MTLQSRDHGTLKTEYREDQKERHRSKKEKKAQEAEKKALSARPRTKRHATLCMPETGKEKKSTGRMPWH